MDLSVDGTKLVDDLRALAAHGRAETGGWTRPALSPADAAARREVIDRARAIGLEIRHDEVGNLRARLRGPDGAPVMTGSHLDSVPSGGYLDGPLGVVGGLRAIEAIARARVPLKRSIELVVFVGEEGSRFPRGTIGSAAMSGHVAVADILALRDADGTRYADALATYGDAGPPLPAPIGQGGAHGFVELHVEQGGVLEAAGLRIGAPTAIAGLVQRQVTFVGDANHAGATPMGLRKDALLAAAEWALAVERAAKEVGGGAVGTVGKLEVHPGGKNIVPGRVFAICDLRAPDAAHLDELERRVIAALQPAAARGVTVEDRRLQRVPPGPLDERIVSVVERGAQAAGERAHRMISGAIHDALHMAEVVPAAMIFVPSIGGKSHCPEEETAPEHLALGATVLAHTLALLATE